MRCSLVKSTLGICLAALFVSLCQAQSVRECAEGRGILIGAAVRPQLFSERAYSYTLAREFNLVEPEDAMKWWTLRPDVATFDFTQADWVVDFAETHRMKVRGHTLVWGWSNPSWLSEDSFSPAQLNKLLHEHIAKVVTRYRGRVFAAESAFMVLTMSLSSYYAGTLIDHAVPVRSVATLTGLLMLVPALLWGLAVVRWKENVALGE